jgi:integrase
MSLYKKGTSKHWWYTFYFQGRRYRASTHQTTRTAAFQVENAALTRLEEGLRPDQRRSRPPTLQQFSARFLEWVDKSWKLTSNSKKFYRYGWRLLSFTALANMTLESIQSDTVECTTFTRPVIDRRSGEPTGETVACSATYINQAIRTLSVMFGKAQEWKLIPQRPHFDRMPTRGRDRMVSQAAEVALQCAFGTAEPNPWVRGRRERAWLIFVILQDTGMRPDEVFPMRIEDLHWEHDRIWVPTGKTPNATRFVGMSDRMKQLLSAWCMGRDSGWVFPSAQAASGHVETIAKGFRAARLRAGVDPAIVPYSARHTYGTETMAATGNIFAVSKSMGHADIKSMKPYQHPDIAALNDAINERNRRTSARYRAPGHIFGHPSDRIQ